MISHDTGDTVDDVEAIGAHCQLEHCHRLDFLPKDFDALYQRHLNRTPSKVASAAIN